MNVTPSPTENPSPGSVISKALIVASETEDTLTVSSDANNSLDVALTILEMT